MSTSEFENTEIAFRCKSDSELKKTEKIYYFLDKKWLLKMGSILDHTLLPLKLPFAKPIIKSTIFQLFCGGENLHEAKAAVSNLQEQNVKSVLDYGKEAKQTNEDFDASVRELTKTIEFASDNKEVPVISLKITALARFDLLKKVQESQNLNASEKEDYKMVLKRLEVLGTLAEKKNVSVFIDAEESWIQDTIDSLVEQMMQRHNKQRVIIYNTVQMYRKDRLSYLKQSHKDAKKSGYVLGVKLVRGAYMIKEAKRASKMGYPNPIHNSKEEVDKDYNDALRYCVDNFEDISLCLASHNDYSCQLLTELMEEKGIKRNNYHFSFCQLYGMSDNITFNLANEGYNVAKYVPYGDIEDVIPYLVRRAQENASVTGSMNRERELILQELKRRKSA